MDKELLRSEWVGRIVEGRFSLLESLPSIAPASAFRTEMPGQRFQKAVIWLIPADAVDAQAQLADWATAAGLSHPHLARVFAHGLTRLDGDVLYVVTEFPEETLSQVLPERALTAAEAGEMLSPVLEALSFVHSKGLVHGSLRPTNVLVVGDQVKLSSDTLQRPGRAAGANAGREVYDAPEIAAAGASTASDLWALGVTLVEALTQHAPQWDRSAAVNPIVPEGMPQPYAGIARRCLQLDPALRCTLADVRMMLKQAGAETPEVTPNVPSSPGIQTPARVQTAGASAPEAPRRDLPKAPPSPAERSIEKAEQVTGRPKLNAPAIADRSVIAANVTFAKQTLRSPEKTQESPRSNRLPMLIGVLVVVLLLVAGVIFYSRRSGTTAPEQSHPSSPADGGSISQPAAPSVSAPTTAPPPARTATSPSAGTNSKGEALDRVMPDIPAKASGTIHGKVEVTIRVDVDPDGRVSEAVLTSPGHSRYFANKALEAGRKWRFRAPQQNGNSRSSVWRLHFIFTRARMEATADEITP